jgi:hypothetical protein
MKTKIGLLKILAATGLLMLAGGVRASDATAFELVKEGNKSVPEHCRNRVVEIRSEKSINGVVPTIWYVYYYDSLAKGKVQEVKFGGGKVMSVKQPLRIWARVRDRDVELNSKALNVDSDKALKIALKEPVLERVKIVATSMHLENYEETPTWKIKLWAAKLKKPDKDVEIGEIFVSANDGKVVKTDVKISKVD